MMRFYWVFLSTMLSYQHAYHAGNFADVIKHVALCQLLDYLVQKDKPIFYLETHAGQGKYSLTHPFAKKTKEYVTGILPIWQKKTKLPSTFQTYINLITSVNPARELSHYPGSPLIAKTLLRDQDRLYLCEKHPKTFQQLCLDVPKKQRRHLSQEDGWQALKACLPPPEKRGLIFIDPSFEDKKEYQSTPKQLFDAYQRFPQGVFCLWYPITAHQSHLALTKKLKNLAFPETLHIEFFLHPPKEISQMHGMGLWLINPPFTLKESMRSVLTSCKEIFNPTQSFFVID